jgi:hypothetical protein
LEYLYESIVLHYLTHEGRAFVSPQFSVKGKSGRVWSTPDFVLLDFDKREVQIVEVSVDANPRKLLKKVAQRENQWIVPLKQQFATISKEFDEWPIIVRIFVRGGHVQRFKSLSTSEFPVRAEKIEDVLLRWSWPWGRKPDGKDRGSS